MWSQWDAGMFVPFVPGKENLDWNIPNPKGQPIEFFREIRDSIEQEVGKLLKEIYFNLL